MRKRLAVDQFDFVTPQSLQRCRINTHNIDTMIQDEDLGNISFPPSLVVWWSEQHTDVAYNMTVVPDFVGRDSRYTGW